jgi:putative membrane protein
VSWFAGLFYIVRLFIYAQEAKEMEEPKKSILIDQLVIMQKKLWWIITTPAMVLSVIFGIWMLVINPAFLKMPWMHIKLTFVVFLLIYHFYSQRLLRNCENNLLLWSSGQLRIWNEVATLFLVSIIFIVVLKGQLSWISGTIGFFGVGILLMLGIKLYKKLRKTQA